MKSFVFIAIFLTISHFATAQVRQLEPDQSPGKGKVEDLAWLVGFWSGSGLGGECEEVWMPAKDGHMIGTFRFWNEGKLVFSEFMNIVQEGDTFSMKLKHFNPDLTGLEDKEEWTTFRLVEVGENTVWFHGLTLERKGDELVIYLALSEKGEQRIEEFRFMRKEL
ncbi:DUF6265 family protein [Algoriphagus sp. A40]|uniref:DUF6265 family protein n=1 Tax=Algoriphagus sp. A40 TaxID=1945863 RepID=UPI000985C7AE|nr:DUF6265 family protein [Algoriphagus sp. A40]OOG78098.1 hypothetical protein B0E43_03030 [Algoriphagus sp. A40]